MERTYEITEVSFPHPTDKKAPPLVKKCITYYGPEDGEKGTPEFYREGLPIRPGYTEKPKPQ